MAASTSDKLLSLTQLATKWGWSRDRVYRLVKTKSIPFVRIGRDFFFRESAVNAWLEAQTVEPTTTPAPKARRRSDREWAEEFGLDPAEFVQ